MEIVFKHCIDGEFQVFFAVGCSVVDDGEYMLPADVIAALEALPGDIEVRYERVIRRLEFRDDVAFFHNIEVVD